MGVAFRHTIASRSSRKAEERCYGPQVSSLARAISVVRPQARGCCTNRDVADKSLRVLAGPFSPRPLNRAHNVVPATFSTDEAIDQWTYVIFRSRPSRLSGM